jgi:hypothetical protein
MENKNNSIKLQSNFKQIRVDVNLANIKVDYFLRKKIYHPID